MRLRVEAGRARTRTSVRVIVGVTIALAFTLALLNQNYLEPYDSSLGQLVLPCEHLSGLGCLQIRRCHFCL